MDTPLTYPPALAAFQSAHAEIAVGVPGGQWLYRETQRDGETLVLLPGAQGTADMFYRIALTIGRELRVITATPPELADCAAVAESLARFLDAIGVSRAHLLGSSLSGHVLQCFAARHASRIGTLFLSNTFCDATEYQAQMPTAESIAATPAQQWLDGMLGRMLQAEEREPAHRELKQAAQALMGPRQSAQALRTRLLALRLCRPAPPPSLPLTSVVLIDADDDAVILPAMRLAMRERFAGCEHHAIDGGGHYPYILRAEQFASIITRRLRQSPS